MRDLGDDLGILGSSIYAHVGGKQELLAAVIERGAAYFDRSAVSAMEQADGPIDALHRLIRGHIDVILDHRSEARTYLSETDFLPPEHAQRITVARDEYELVFVEALEWGRREGVVPDHGTARLHAIYILSILNAIDRWFDEDGPVDRAGLADDIVQFVTSGARRA